MKTNILTLAITLTLGVILAGSLLMPVITDAQSDLGTPITIENPSPSENYCDYYTTDVTIVFDSPAGSTTNATTTITIGEFEADMSTVPVTEILFIGDTFYIQLNPAGGNSMGIVRGYYEASMNANLNLEYQYTLTYTASTGQVLLTSLNHSTEAEAIVFDVESSTFFAIHENGRYSLTRETYGSGQYAYSKMALDPDNITNGTLGAMASTVNLQIGDTTVYTVWTVTKEGVKALGYTEGYTITGTIDVTGDLTLVDGTTDIYHGGTPSITLTGVKDDDPTVTGTITFVPESAYILNKVSGHATSGAAYDLLGAIPIIVIIGLVLAATAAIFAKRDD